MKKETVLNPPNQELVENFLIGKLDVSKDSVSYNMRNENKISEKEIDGIVGFKKFKINYLSEYHSKDRFDCDSSDLAMSIWCYLIELDERVGVGNVLGYNGRTITYVEDGTEQKIETDTINSLSTELNKFIRRIILKRKYGIDEKKEEKEIGFGWAELYQGRYKIKKGELISSNIKEQIEKSNIERDQWLIDNINEIFDWKTLDHNDYEIFEAFEKLADWTHTIGNFMIGPKGFNKRKGAVYGDRLNVFFDEIQNENKYPKWKKWFPKNMSLNKLENYFAEDKFESWDTSNIKKLIIDSNDDNNAEDITKEEIYNTILLIEERGRKMIEALKEHEVFSNLFVK